MTDQHYSTNPSPFFDMPNSNQPATLRNHTMSDETMLDEAIGSHRKLSTPRAASIRSYRQSLQAAIANAPPTQAGLVPSAGFPASGGLAVWGTALWKGPRRRVAALAGLGAIAAAATWSALSVTSRVSENTNTLVEDRRMAPPAPRPKPVHRPAMPEFDTSLAGEESRIMPTVAPVPQTRKLPSNSGFSRGPTAISSARGAHIETSAIATVGKTATFHLSEMAEKATRPRRRLLLRAEWALRGDEPHKARALLAQLSPSPKNTKKVAALKILVSCRLGENVQQAMTTFLNQWPRSSFGERLRSECPSR